MDKKIFTLNGEKFIANAEGQLVPYIKEETKDIKPWGAANNIADIVKILKLSRSSVMNLISNGQLKAVKAGKRWIVPGWAIEAFLKQGA